METATVSLKGEDAVEVLTHLISVSKKKAVTAVPGGTDAAFYPEAVAELGSLLIKCQQNPSYVIEVDLRWLKDADQMLRAL